MIISICGLKDSDSLTKARYGIIPAYDLGDTLMSAEAGPMHVYRIAWLKWKPT
jgi:hypothetical protein